MLPTDSKFLLKDNRKQEAVRGIRFIVCAWIVSLSVFNKIYCKPDFVTLLYFCKILNLFFLIYVLYSVEAVVIQLISSSLFLTISDNEEIHHRKNIH